MNNYDEKIAKIKDTEKYLIEMVKKEIEKRNNILNLNISNVSKLLDYDTTMVKKYEAVVNAQKLIFDFTNQIKECNNVEEIKEIRNKLNYYINKIKKEIKDRGLSEEEFNTYYMNATNLRKDIAKYVRFLKREDKISEIEKLNGNIDNLSKEELLDLKRLLKNEVAYGKKYKEEYEDPFKLHTNKKEVKPINSESLSKLLGQIKTKEVKKEVKPLVIDTNTKKTTELESYNSVEDFIDNKVKEFKTQYRLVKTNKYSGSFIKDVSTLVKNIPIFIENKKKIKKMRFDYKRFYNGPELIAFYEYNRTKNSIFHNIGNVIRYGIFKNRESLYLDEHKKCIKWIKSFCFVNELELKYNKTKTI